ncbi:MAG: hypothetical protein EPN97_00270 [Alphaproteobacteria bacterium]|nr:MAG: hypothetical protein EPN97_00270 [Alphaproteobacteria bacterium]
MEEKNRSSCNLVKAQLVRGAIGICLLIPAALLFTSHFYASLALVALAVIPLRGCPVCWTVGMFEAWSKQKSKPPAKPPLP